MWAGYKGDRHSHFTNCVNETSLHHFLSGRNMAAAAPVQKEEATCSICLEYFTEPVSLESECGHGFCLSCITRYSEGLQTDFPYPQCREILQSKTLRPNRHLANVVGISKQLEVQSATPQEANLSREHEEKLKLFCADDQKPICVVSSMSRDHKPLPIREAAQEYKEKFQNYLDRLKIKLKDILELHRNEETKVTELEAKFKSQREQITKEFEKLQMFLEKEKSRHLSNLEEEEKKSLQSIKETVTKLEEQQFVLRSWITEIELKCQQQDVELLKDAKTVLSRYENMKDQQTDFYTMAGNKEEAEDEEVEKEVDLQRMIIESLEWRRDRRFAAEVTLDPDTAHRRLILSEDGRSVRRGDRALDLPDTPQRFTKYSIVLGRESLSSGRHYWEVEVGDKTGWTLGVCDESVSRKGEITGSPEDGYWTVGLFDGVYVGLTDPSSILSPRVPPRVVGLFMDYEEERLSVYDVDDRSMLFTYCGDFFPHTLRPYFYPGRSDGGRNAGALRILPGTGRE